MRYIEEYRTVQDFLDRVCKQVRAKPMHAEIREELLSHIEERAELLMLEGNAEEPAVLEAVRQMGEPEEIGRSLHMAHRPQLDWKLLVIVGLFSVIGLFGTMSVYYTDVIRFMQIPDRKILFFGIGIFLLIVLYFTDYRKLRRFAGMVFFSVLFLLGYVLVYGKLHGYNTGYLGIGFIGVNMITFSLLPLLVAQAGMKPAFEWGRWEMVLNLLYRGVLPIVLYSMSNSVMYSLIYAAGFLVLTWRTKKNPRQFVLIMTLPLASLTISLFTHMELLLIRWRDMLNPLSGYNWHVGNSISAIKNAGWFGQGFGAESPKLPYILNDSVFPYLVYCFGWIFGIAVVVLTILFLIRIWKVSKTHRDLYARHMAAMIMVVFGIRLLWPLLMGIGIAPLVSLDPPFISYGGTNQLIDLAVVGLILSIYRRKNMIPSDLGGIEAVRVK
ncbi:MULTISPECIES: FtsW/RodA/SpoVE family cell cycle protein [Paenibacillus]|uniref:Cell division membrane protein-like protein n=2 Tax=Paenibacillus lactis TaxID=228574 RepID=G4HHS0_9BACL|nr:FtsW/RodA/SpoVE family cell cycle protein [Paenibacillus lactis]EHB63646.1 cell division membrane protein-like protein [Paenibacillus lactis 154]MBP1891928.1 cell division protein FtsW (lipid II flippase) [Paenibacillus lactis]